jgi:hypothetical protein
MMLPQDCQEIWRRLYFLRFRHVFGAFNSWKTLYLQVRALTVDYS